MGAMAIACLRENISQRSLHLWLFLPLLQCSLSVCVCILTTVLLLGGDTMTRTTYKRKHLIGACLEFQRVRS